MADRQEIFVALGGNLPLKGDHSADVLRQSVHSLEQEGLHLERMAPFYRTPAFPAGAGPDFVNSAAVFSSELPAIGVLEALHRVEAAFGRERTERWGERTLDLDLLAIGEMVAPNPKTWARWFELPLAQQQLEIPDELILPHPRIQDRAFVLVPLGDVAESWIHPVLGKTVRQMCDELPVNLRDEVVLL